MLLTITAGKRIGITAVSLVLIFVLFSITAISAEPVDSTYNDTGIISKYWLNDVDVTGTRSEKNSLDIPQIVQIISKEELTMRKNYRTFPELLKENSGVMVQKTGHGQGSPYLRGFTGFRTVLLIDGIRLNNSVFRDGPNQYWTTVDPFSIDQVEVIKGINSSLHGSDAIGGFVAANTAALDFKTRKLIAPYRLYTRFASAENANINRLEIIGSPVKTLRYKVGVSLKKFGNIQGGSTVSDQPQTGYDEYDADIKLTWAPYNFRRISLVHQNVQILDAWRTHKTIHGINWSGTSNGSDLKYTLDQKRQLTYIRFEQSNPLSLFSDFHATASLHSQSESQHRVRKTSLGARQSFDVNTVGLNIQSLSTIKPVSIIYGVDFYLDNVDSHRSKYDENDLLISTAAQGAVADDASYRTADIFVHSETKLKPHINLIAGWRYSSIAVEAEKIQNPFDDSIYSMSENWSKSVGNLRILFNHEKFADAHFFAGISQGFRAPNLSDLTRFDIARSDEIEIPSIDLEPEEFLAYEGGLKFNRKNINFQLAYFRTEFDNMIIRTATGDTDSEGNWFVTKKNSGAGNIDGFEIDGRIFIIPQVSISFAYSWTHGTIDTYTSEDQPLSREPLDRMMPPTGHMGLMWDPLNDTFWIEVIMTTASKQDQLSTRDKSDLQRIPPGGTPGYTVTSIRCSRIFRQNLSVSLMAENIGNTDYRIHGSGLNEAGLNIILGVDYKF